MLLYSWNKIKYFTNIFLDQSSAVVTYENVLWGKEIDASDSSSKTLLENQRKMMDNQKTILEKVASTNRE